MYSLDPTSYIHRSSTPVSVQKRSRSQMKMITNSAKRSTQHSQAESSIDLMHYLSISEEKLLISLRDSPPQAEIKDKNFQSSVTSQNSLNSLLQQNRELHARCIRSELSYEKAIRELTQELQRLQLYKSRAETARTILTEVQEMRNRLDKVEAIARSVLNE